MFKYRHLLYLELKLQGDLSLGKEDLIQLLTVNQEITYMFIKHTTVGFKLQ